MICEKLRIYIRYIVKLIKSNNKVSILKEIILSIKYFGVYSGVKEFLKEKVYLEQSISNYHDWFLKVHHPSQLELESQMTYRFKYMPLISIIVPSFNTPKQFLIDMVESVIAQTYLKWELCIADGASTDQESLSILKAYSLKDSRIKVILLSENYHISGNTNKAIEISSGDYLGFLDHDDLLTPNCLFEYVNAINQYNKPALLYCDEDKINTSTYTEPTFKPDFGLYTLRSSNYICHFMMIRKDILDQAGIFDTQCDGAQDYDMVLRIADITSNILHIPKVLYHWRIHETSTASSSKRIKSYAHDAGRLALDKHLQRNNILGKVLDGYDVNTYKVKYLLSMSPLVSIIITHVESLYNLKKCIESIKRKSFYLNYEIIIVKSDFLSLSDDNLEFIKKAFNIKVILCKDVLASSTASVSNLGAEYAKGEYLVFMDGNLRIITPNWIEELLSLASQDKVGVVGPKLVYPNGRICSAGIILGIGKLGAAVHAYHNISKFYVGYNNRLIKIQNTSAIALSCIMIQKAKFDTLSGFDGSYNRAFIDIDLCMRFNNKGYSTVWTPYAELCKYLLNDLNYEDEYKDLTCFNDDLITFAKRYNLWCHDPYYNVNFSQSDGTYGISF